MSASSVMQPVQQHAQRHAPHRQDTFQIRQQHEEELQQHSDHSSLDYHQQQQQQPYQGHYTSTSDEEHSILEDDSADEQYIEDEDQVDDDGSSSLSIPSESIDFDLVYSIQRFVATVEGQANVDKGDSLFLMDDSNSYWWLVRVLKTQEVGYIPAENIETPFERLARLNKYRNVDVSAPHRPNALGSHSPSSHPQLNKSKERTLALQSVLDMLSRRVHLTRTLLGV